MVIFLWGVAIYLVIGVYLGRLLAEPGEPNLAVTCLLLWPCLFLLLLLDGLMMIGEWVGRMILWGKK